MKKMFIITAYQENVNQNDEITPHTNMTILYEKGQTL